MNELTAYKRSNLLVTPDKYMKDPTQLPPYISYDEYMQLRESVYHYWSDKTNFLTDKMRFLIDRDILLIDFLWETGGRISDILTICFKDFNGKTLYLYNQKRSKDVAIPISSELFSDTLGYLKKWGINDEQRLFVLTQQRAWQLVRQYGLNIGFPMVNKVWGGKTVRTSLRPHLFRHGMAIHLLKQGVNIKVISTRLGHSNVQMTMNMYMKITPEDQEMFLQNVKWR